MDRTEPLPLAPASPQAESGPAPVQLSLRRMSALARSARVENKIARYEQELLLKAMTITSAELSASEIGDGNGGEIPDAWRKEGVPEERLERKLRIAQDGRRGPKSRPGYLTTAANITAALLKARATKQAGGGGAGTMNVQINVVEGDQHVYPSREES